MWERRIGPVVPPATTAEACALRKARGGDCGSGGSSIAQLRAAIKARYHWNPPARTVGFDALWSALAPGHGAVVLGSMGAFPQGSHWRRFDPGFAGRHATYVERTSDGDTVLWDDPLAPAGHYNGETMPKADLKRYVEAWPGAMHLVGEIDGWSGGPNVSALRYNVLGPGGGIATVTGDGHSYVKLGGPDDGQLVRVAAGFAKPVLARIAVEPPFGPAYLVGDRAAFLLVRDTAYTPPEDPCASLQARVDAAVKLLEG